MSFFFTPENEDPLDRIGYTNKDWWVQIDPDGKQIQPDGSTGPAHTDMDDGDHQPRSRRDRLLNELKEIPMTPALQILLNSRRVRTEQEVESEFNNRQKLLQSGQLDVKSAKKNVTPHFDEEVFSERREKSQCLLLPSHLETMREVYMQLDRYNDEILKRSDFLMQLRTDSRIVDFIDIDAVKVAAAKPKVLVFDQVLVEIEKDEMYEAMHSAKNADSTNHKEFITWKEFLGYF